MFQLKGQDRIPEKELNRMEIRNLRDKEFKAMVIDMLNEFSRRLDEFSENFNIETENIKKEPIRTEEYYNRNEKKKCITGNQEQMR